MFRRKVFVDSILEGAPALGKLEAGDLILAVDGSEVATGDDVVRLITAHAPGETVRDETAGTAPPPAVDPLREGDSPVPVHGERAAHVNGRPQDPKD